MFVISRKFLLNSIMSCTCYSNEIMRKARINPNSILFFFLFPFVLISIIFINVDYVLALDGQNDQLIEKIAKDYTNKFCNSLAFGLSKESAMDFAMKESNQIFKKKKGFDSLNKVLLAHEIAISVDYKCGNRLSFKGKEEIENFETDYMLMNAYNLLDN